MNGSKVYGARQRNIGRHGASLADALFTSTQQRVLALLFGQPSRSFFVNELVGLTESRSGAVQRELARLAQGGLVTVSKVGNQKHYQVCDSWTSFQFSQLQIDLIILVLQPFFFRVVVIANIVPVRC